MATILRHTLEWLFLVPVIGGSVYALLCLWAVLRFRLQARARKAANAAAGADAAPWPPVTILKPICGMEKRQEENLRSACTQDYPDYQVVFSVQSDGDPALPLLRKLRQEFGDDRVSVAVESFRTGTNGKVNNMIGGLRHARHDVLVISDSDVLLKPDYLKAIVAPLDDPGVGCACTFYKAAHADAWYEKVELLTLNADFITNVLFAHASGASKFCLGASAAIRRSTLEEIGGLEGLSDYLVEDYEMGRRVWEHGKKVVTVPYFVDTVVDLKSPSAWWNHQVYWDQNTRAARPYAFLSTALIRSVPFAFLFAALRLADPAGLAVLGGAMALRLLTAAGVLGWGLRDREGLRALWLLPFRDLSSLGTWLLAFTRRTTVWRGASFVLTKDGRLVDTEREPVL
ncbi:MAG: bacteriohopanetetrol glucosamine biosynthesis glycosyltransferase HpnI [Acidobacteriota bacterium]|jgi:ceramide glucosyltransferase|nr:bacteriohopanetetrol glucosamine biosynthesis glycosyltransferase HpnI [Acidobacteriota bacterium]